MSMRKKKIITAVFAFFCCLAFLIGIFMIPIAAFAEGEASTVPYIDVTQIVISVASLLFNVLLAIAIKVVVPPVREWLTAKTTNEQRKLIDSIIKQTVEAAEQMFIGKSKGSEKMKYVIKTLNDKGITIDVPAIEAAVKEMNDSAYITLNEEFTIEPDSIIKEE